MSETTTEFTYTSDGFANLQSSEITVTNPDRPEQKSTITTWNSYGASVWHKRYGRLTETTVTKTLKDIAPVASGHSGGGSDDPPNMPPVGDPPPQCECEFFPCNCEKKKGFEHSKLVNVGTIKFSSDFKSSLGTQAGSHKTQSSTSQYSASNASYEINNRLTTKTVTHVSSFSYYPENYSGSDGFRGLLKSETTEPGTDKAVTKIYSYDKFANKTKVESRGKQLDGASKRFTHTLSRFSTSEYDESGQFLMRTQNQLGHEKSYIYNKRFGLPKTVTRMNGLVTRSEFDSLGRVTKTTNPTETYVESKITACESSSLCQSNNEAYFTQSQNLW